VLGLLLVHTAVEEGTHLVWTPCSRTCTADVGYSDRCCPCHNPPSGSSPIDQETSLGLLYHFIYQPLTIFVYAKRFADMNYIILHLLY